MTTELKTRIIEIYKENPSLVHSVIGEMVGTSRSTVQRTIFAYKKELAANGETEANHKEFANMDLFGQEPVKVEEKEEQKENIETPSTPRIRIRPRVKNAVAEQNISEFSREALEEMYQQSNKKNKVFSSIIKCMSPTREMDRSKNERVLLISDLHAPYHHPDAIDFLNALEERYEFDCVINMGDELDNKWSYNFPDMPEGLLSKEEEISEAKKIMGYLETIFPEMDLVSGNHHRIRSELFAPYTNWLFIDEEKGEFTPKTDYYGRMKGLGWKNVGNTNTYKLSDGSELYVQHDISWKVENLRDCRRRNNAHIAQGHHHSLFGIDWMNEDGLEPLAAVSTGCLINPNAPSFKYGSEFQQKPVIGCAGFLDGEPTMFRMKIDKNGRWTGKL